MQGHRARHIGTAFLAAIAVLTADAAVAQIWAGSASLGLTVKSGKGRPVAGAVVTIAFRDVGFGDGPAPRETTGNGEVGFSGLAEGRWSLKIDHPEHLSYLATVVIRENKKPDILSEFLEATGEGRLTMRVKLDKGPSESKGVPVERSRPAASTMPEADEPQVIEPSPTAEATSAVEIPVLDAQPPPPVAEAERESNVGAVPSRELQPAAPQGAPQPEPTTTPQPAAPSEKDAVPPAAASEAPPTETSEVGAPFPEAEAELEVETPKPAAEEPPAPETAARALPATRVPDEGVVQESPGVDEDSVGEPPVVDEAALAPTPDLEEAPPAPDQASASPPADPAAHSVGMPAEATASPEVADEPLAVDRPDAEPTEPSVETEEHTESAGSAMEFQAQPEPEASAPATAQSAAAPSGPGAAVSIAGGSAELPAPAPLTSFQSGDCLECRPGEWAVEVSARMETISPSACDATAAAIEDGLRSVSESARSSLADYWGPVPAASLGLTGTLADQLDDESCRLFAVALPIGSRYAGFRLRVEDANGNGDCVPERSCPIGEAMWLFTPSDLRLDGAVVVFSVFRNEAVARTRQATMTVFFVPGSEWLDQRSSVQ